MGPVHNSTTPKIWGLKDVRLQTRGTCVWQTQGLQVVLDVVCRHLEQGIPQRLPLAAAGVCAALVARPCAHIHTPDVHISSQQQVLAAAFLTRRLALRSVAGL